VDVFPVKSKMTVHQKVTVQVVITCEKQARKRNVEKLPENS